MFRRPICYIVIAILFLSMTHMLFAFDCASCGAKGISALAMCCPFCNARLHSPTSNLQKTSTAILSIDIFYSGDQPERLPEYGKVYINGIYRGNIPRVECEPRNKSIDSRGLKGLGFDYTAKYHTEFNTLQEGMAKVEIDMKFRRMFGIAHSVRRVSFPYVALKAGEKTSLQHTFNSCGTFNKQNAAASATPKLNKLSPQIGTFAIEVPFFE